MLRGPDCIGLVSEEFGVFPHFDDLCIPMRTSSFDRIVEQAFSSTDDIFKSCFACCGKGGTLIINPYGFDDYVGADMVQKLNLQVQPKEDAYSMLEDYNLKPVIAKDESLVSFSLST